jgi:hypothetical protein
MLSLSPNPWTSLEIPSIKRAIPISIVRNTVVPTGNTITIRANNGYKAVKSQDEPTKIRFTKNTPEPIFKMRLAKGEITSLPGIVDIQEN